MISGLFSLPLAPADAAETAQRAPNGDSSEEVAERFIVGPENALVRALANAAVTDPLTHNPIVLCGPIGVGKSSLAHALAALRRQRFPRASVIATSGADLAGALAHAVDTASVADFRERHRRCDVLVIDDVEFLANKPAAQQFLLTALDALLCRGSLVIATARFSLGGPQATGALMPALASRLTGGLVVPFSYPGALARRELVQQTAARVRLPLSDDAISLLVGNGGVPRLATVARLRHAVFQLATTAQANQCRIDVAQVAQLLADDAPDAKSVCRRATAAVAKHLRIAVGELKGKSRRQAAADARSLAMYLSRRLTGASYAELGRQFGGRDHTTVLHACRKLERLTRSNEEVRRLADELVAEITADGMR